MRAGTPGFQSERLIEARKARGLTRVLLAEKIGRAPATVSRWESGDQSPEPEAVDLLANRLDVPRDYFLKVQQSFGNHPKFFRSMAAATLRARERIEGRMRWLQELCSDLQEWIEFPKVEIPSANVRDFRALRDEDIEIAAENCRSYWQLGAGPIPDMLLVLENAGVVVGRDWFDTNTIDGLSNWSTLDNRPYILLALDKQTAVRSRFDAAHELGHLVLHRSVEAKTLQSSADFKELERQAHRFASAFLLPAQSFSTELSVPTLDAFLGLKLRWGVSVAAMIHRCRNLNIISEIHAGRLWRSKSARKWTSQEPYDDKIEPEKTRILERSIRLLLSEGGFSLHTLLSKIRLNASDIESLAGLPEGFLRGDYGHIYPMPTPKLRKKEFFQDVTGQVFPFPRTPKPEASKK